MGSDLGQFFTLIVGSPTQAAVLGWVVLLLGVSLAIGWVLRRPNLEGAAFGLLALTAGADLSQYTQQALGLQLHLHPLLTLAWLAPLVLCLRRWGLPRPAAMRSLTKGEIGLMVLSGAAFWVVRIIQVDPSSNLSSQLGWLPLYLKSSFAMGRFLLPTDFQFGIGPVGSLFYSVDMSGVVALAGNLGAQGFYPTYLATSIASIGLAFMLLLGSLRGSFWAQLTFVAILAADLIVDKVFQAGLVRHWGDNCIILGGALILHALTRRPGRLAALLTAAQASAFMVLARHYAAFFAALTMAGGALLSLSHNRRKALAAWSAWLVAGCILVLLSAREIYYILHPTVFYPGKAQLTVGQNSLIYHLRGILHDWGFMRNWEFDLFGPRGAWFFALVLLLWCKRWAIGRDPRRLLVYLAPFALMLMPLMLEILTAYRSSGESNKSYLLAAFFPSFFPALVVHWLGIGRAVQAKWSGRLIPAALIAVLLWGLAGPWAGWGLGRVLGHVVHYYRGGIADMNVAAALVREGLAEQVAGRPLMYFYCEPGMGLRNYIGGTLDRDLDFWSDTVLNKAATVPNLESLMAELGWPNLYLSSLADYRAFAGDGWLHLEGEIANIETKPWVERVVRYRNSRVIVVKRP